MICSRSHLIVVVASLSLAAGACDDSDTPATDTKVDATSEVTPDTSPDTDVIAATPCSRIGGYAAVSGAVYDKANPVNPATLVGTIAGDCKVNAFFTSLSPTALNHVGECLAIQVSELLGCEEATYAGSKDSAGVICRDMVTTHKGMQVSKGDFDALIADIVTFTTPLVEAGLITEAEFGAAAGVLLSLEGSIVEDASVDISKGICAEP